MKLVRGFLTGTALCAAILAPCALPAQNNDDFDPLAAGIEENIRQPAVAPKHSKAVAAAMERLAVKLRHEGYNVSAVRSGEVIVVTLPCSLLFPPNSTSLSPKGESRLAPLTQFVEQNDKYKVIVAAHSDDTGDSLYADRLTADRANTVDDYFYRALGEQDSGIIPYGLGGDEPLMPNHGIENRAMNRRVEIYFVPTRAFIDKAKNR